MILYKQIMNVEQFQLSDLLIVGDVVPLVDKIMNKQRVFWHYMQKCKQFWSTRIRGQVARRYCIS